MAIIPGMTAEQVSMHSKISQDRDKTVIYKDFKWSDLVEFRNYAHGKQKLILSDKQKELLKGLNTLKFCDNVCHQIISESAGRVQFLGWDCKNEAVKDWLDDFYKLNRIEGRSGEFHYTALGDGNFVIALNWDNKKKRVKCFKEPWWDGTSGIYLHYDSSGELEYAVKEWSEDKIVMVNNSPTANKIYRRTIWFEDRIERWVNEVGPTELQWMKFILDSDKDEEGADVWPMPWKDKDGEPLGIPFVHFPNVGRTYGDYGVSELDGGVIGFQDHLNDIQFSITISNRMTGAQMYYATGVKQRKKDGTDVYESLKVEAGRFLTSENPDSTFGVLPAGDIDKQINGYHLKLKRVSQITATPLHVISGGDWPSGEALLRAEMPAVHKAWKQIFRFATSWIDVATTAIKIHNRFSGEKEINYDIKDGIIESKFADPEKRDSVSRSIIVHNLGPNISIREALRIMNYSREEAEEIYQEKVEEEQNSTDMMTASVLKTSPGDGTSNLGKKEPKPKAATGGNSNVKATDKAK